MRPRAQLNLVRPVQFTRTRPSSENCRCGPCLFSRLRSLAGSAGILLIVATFGPPLHYRPATLFLAPRREGNGGVPGADIVAPEMIGMSSSAC